MLSTYYFHSEQIKFNQMIVGVIRVTEEAFFFLSGFSFTNIHNSQDNRGSERLFI